MSTIVGLEKAKLLFDDGMPVNLTSEQVGFSSPKYFNICFKKQYQCTPTEYKSRVSK